MNLRNNLDNTYWNLIWEKFRSGDREAFDIIYKEFVDGLYSYGSKITSDKNVLEDSIQDLFIDVYRYNSKLRNPESLEFYLVKSLKRIILRKIKEINRFDFNDVFPENFNLRFAIEDVSENDKFERQLKILQNEIKNLDSQKRELLFLKFNSGLTNVEIGELLDIKPDTVKKQIQRLLKFIKGKMEDKMINLFVFFIRI